MANSMTLSYIGKIAQSMNIESICFHREHMQMIFGIRQKLLSSNYLIFDKVFYFAV